ncbi:hypothetical protein HELRODRAFT_175696 [Helobdella robusta]|uniref:Uncharacterized protein n=1 Tax=Helobdella robusta TaxID=6412 RepID=T1F9J4_HELRO|nr:hypothetical protein HELRODRAFT_175696 [Helobdella robusta]ESO00707.1 hypothetical protein HELRODRAFT_175696 [Helobdella robusta]
MDEMYKMMYDSLSVKQKLVRVIKENALKKFKEIIESSDLTNSVLDSQSEETTLHMCIRQKNLEMIKFLLKKGADPTQKNLFNASSLDICIDVGDADCMIALLEYCPISLHGYWKNFKTENEEIIKVMIVGTQSLNAGNLDITYFKRNESPQSTDLKKLVYLTNSTISLPPHFLSSPDFNAWHHTIVCEVPTLRHCSRIFIRKSFRYNTYYSSQRLVQLPSEIRKYLIGFSDCLY